MPRNRTWVVGTCPVCDRDDQKMCNHHCHLRDLVIPGVKEGVTLLTGDRDLADKVVGDNQAWATDAGVLALQRFDNLFICEGCNAVDVQDPLSKPGPCFSLSPMEIREIRHLAGHADNFGPEFLNALRTVRRRETEQFRFRASLAPFVGRALALRFHLEGQIERTREKLLEAKARSAAPKHDGEAASAQSLQASA